MFLSDKLDVWSYTGITRTWWETGVWANAQWLKTSFLRGRTFPQDIEIHWKEIWFGRSCLLSSTRFIFICWPAFFLNNWLWFTFCWRSVPLEAFNCKVIYCCLMLLMHLTDLQFLLDSLRMLTSIFVSSSRHHILLSPSLLCDEGTLLETCTIQGKRKLKVYADACLHCISTSS